MNVGELMDELVKYRREEAVLIKIPSDVAGGSRCDTCGESVSCDWEPLLRPTGSKRIFRSNLTVFIETEDSGERR